MAMNLSRGGTQLKPNYTDRLNERLQSRSDVSIEHSAEEKLEENVKSTEHPVSSKSELAMKHDTTTEKSTQNIVAETTKEEVTKPDKKVTVSKSKQTVSNNRQKNMDQIHELMNNNKRCRVSFMVSSQLRQLLSFYCAPVTRAESMSDIIEEALIEYFSKEEVFNDNAFQYALDFLQSTNKD